MSAELDRFLERIGRDAHLRRELVRRTENDEDPVARVVELADRYGFDLDPEDRVELDRLGREAAGVELTEEEMEAVAGGLAQLSRTIGFAPPFVPSHPAPDDGDDDEKLVP